MATASPSILTPANEFVNFTVSISVTDLDLLGAEVPATITGVSASLGLDGVTVSISPGTVTLSGKYINIFTNKSFDYLTKQTDSLVSSDYISIPSKIYALITFVPDKTLNKTNTITITTSSGSTTVTQVVRNNWDTGKAQMLDVLARGE